jgi:hypothetical protein
MRFIRRIKGITRSDRIRNETVISGLNIKPIELLIDERQLSWLGNIHRVKDERLTREMYETRVQGKNKIGRP